MNIFHVKGNQNHYNRKVCSNDLCAGKYVEHVQGLLRKGAVSKAFLSTLFTPRMFYKYLIINKSPLGDIGANK